MRARLKVDGLAEAITRVDETGDRARRPEPVLRSDATLLDLQMGERRKFARGGWRKDTPAWIKEKRRRGLDSRTMVASGRLESALTNATHGVKATSFNGVLTWGIRAGRSEVYYAQPLAKGVGNPPKKRRAVVIDKTTKGQISARVERYIADGVIA